MTLTGFSQMKGYKEEKRDTKGGRARGGERESGLTEMCSNKKRRETNPTGRIHPSAVGNVKSVVSVSVRAVPSHSKQTAGKQSKETAEVVTSPPPMEGGLERRRLKAEALSWKERKYKYIWRGNV